MVHMGEAFALFAAVVGLAAVWIAWLNTRASDQQAVMERLTALERRIEAIMIHLEVEDPLPHPDLTAVHRHLDRGEKIAAIKAYREATGAGLKQAKDDVEAIERRRSA